LPLDTQNWITGGNALRLDWQAVQDAGKAGDSRETNEGSIRSESPE
jgi:hypothetical protein